MDRSISRKSLGYFSGVFLEVCQQRFGIMGPKIDKKIITFKLA